jgi:hypothetical protein
MSEAIADKVILKNTTATLLQFRSQETEEEESRRS